MKAYAEIVQYGRLVGMVLTRPDAKDPNAVNLAHIPGEYKMLTSIESQVEWGADQFYSMTPFTGYESAVLQIEEVQLIFDALWKAGMRPTHE